MKFKSAIVALFLLIVQIAAWAAPVSKPNVVLMIGDDIGQQLGCYGQPGVRTPNIDKLANSGMRFVNAYTAVSSCSPSRAALLTGLYPHQSGQRCLAQFEGCHMPQGTQTIVHVLRSAGYRCGAIGKVHVDPVPPFHSVVNLGVPAARDYRNWVNPVRNFLVSSQGKPFFLWVGFSEAHRGFVKQYAGRPNDPLTTATPLAFMQVDNLQVRRDTALYLDGIMRADDCVWAIMSELRRAGRDQDTIVIFVGDNGAPYARAKTTCYEAGTRVPLIIRHPAQTTTGTVNALVSTTDICPTILEETGTTMTRRLPGRSLSRVMRGQYEPWRQWLVTSMDWHCPWEDLRRRAITDGQSKLIVNYFYPKINNVNQQGEPTLAASKEPGVPYQVASAYQRYIQPPARELFDLSRDPHELINLANDPSTQTSQTIMLKELSRWQSETGDPEMGKTQ